MECHKNETDVFEIRIAKDPSGQWGVKWYTSHWPFAISRKKGMAMPKKPRFYSTIPVEVFDEARRKLTNQQLRLFL